MRGYWLMLQNELILAWRRYRLVVLALVFLLFGIEAPLVAKLTPALLKSIGQGMTITLPEPTSVMAWQQYYKNMTQIGLFVLAIVASGTVSRELNEGTLVILVAKGLRRNAVIMAKYTMALLQWVVALVLAFGVTYAYTVLSRRAQPASLAGAVAAALVWRVVAGHHHLGLDPQQKWLHRFLAWRWGVFGPDAPEHVQSRAPFQPSESDQ